MNLKLVTIFVFGLAVGVYASEPKNATSLLSDNLDETTSHYKSVLTELADKKMSVKIAKDQSETRRLENDIDTLESEKENTQEKLGDLVKNYNASLRKISAARQDQKNLELITGECEIAAANSHYKSVLTELANRKTSVKIIKDQSEAQRLENDIDTLESEKKNTQEKLGDLVKSYNASLRKTHAARQDRENLELITVESEIVAANSHYKTVTTQISDKKAAIALGKDSNDVNSDVSVLEDDKDETQQTISDLMKAYNSLSKKLHLPANASPI